MTQQNNDTSDQVGQETGEHLNVTDVVNMGIHAQKVLKSINEARKEEDPIDKIIIDRIVREEMPGDIDDSYVAMPRQFDIVDFMDSMDRFRHDNGRTLNGLYGR